LGGWTVADESSSHVYKFRNIHFADEIVLHSSLGKDNATDIFWNSKTPIWNNAGDTIFLRDDRGLLALSHSYS
jgi:competence protein ComEC